MIFRMRPFEEPASFGDRRISQPELTDAEGATETHTDR